MCYLATFPHICMRGVETLGGRRMWKMAEKEKNEVVVLPLILLVVAMSMMINLVNTEEGGECRPPLFVFGASMLDVGENEAATPGRGASEFPPYGLNYFGRPAARYSNGRLSIDFISQGMGYGLVDPYLRSVGSNFKHGVNFASSGATLNSTLFSLSVQIDQFQFFKASVLALHHTEGSNKSTLTTEDFFEGVYIIQIGHNDYSQYFLSNDGHNGDAFVSETIQLMKKELVRLYNNGARKIVVMNLMPLGCTPGALGSMLHTKDLHDEYGCLISFNDLIDNYNWQLALLLKELHQQFSNAQWILFDINAIIYNAVRNPAYYGVKYPLKACCGVQDGNYNFDSTQQCGSANATVCEDSTHHIFWDGIHIVEYFHHILGKEFLEGKNLSPKFFIRESCNVSN